MSVVIGYVLISVGIIGAFFMEGYISSACIIMAIAGVLLILFSIIKKRNEDTLSKINNMGKDGTQLGVCPNCGINVTQETQICPKCGTKINNTKGIN